MTRRLGLLVAAVVVLAVIYGVMLLAWPEARPKVELAKGQARAVPQEPREYEEVVVTVEIPARDKTRPMPRGGPDGEGCPAHRVPRILGITFGGGGGGLGVGTVVPEGPAAKAGMKPGDLIAKCEGEPIDCPRTLARHLRQSSKPRQVEMTLRRPKAEEGDGEKATGPHG